ncbi:MAG: 16S rRNA (cytosine(1402)-N(4))-methyltransferase [Pyrinomonadaceae bacterium]|nr:16S rRNA (cytosine(1402)-N(4))-methyltransferase [Pyrinomonadaceae bacterium]
MALLGCAKAVVCSLKMQHDLADFTHEPVLLNEVLEMLDAKKGGVYVDATLGLGGHTEAILAANDQNVVIGLDQDGEAIRRAAERLRPYGKRFRAVHANFSAIASLADVESADGLVADLGVSSMQLDDSGRFSFRADAPLDMRMDTDTGVPTATFWPKPMSPRLPTHHLPVRREQILGVSHSG